MTVLGGAADSIIATTTTGGAPSALCYNPRDNKVYCAGSNSVAVISGASDQVFGTIEVGESPCDFVWNPVQNRVHVADLVGSCISVLRDSPHPGVFGSGAEVLNRRPGASTIIRGVLYAQKASSHKPQAALLLDISGRKVLDLKPGANDVRVLASGVCFVRERGDSREQGGAGVRKVVVTR